MLTIVVLTVDDEAGVGRWPWKRLMRALFVVLRKRCKIGHVDYYKLNASYGLLGNTPLLSPVLCMFGDS